MIKNKEFLKVEWETEPLAFRTFFCGISSQSEQDTDGSYFLG